MTGADNQQETLLDHLYYYTGFCIGEFSCSLLKLSNRKSKKGGIYYTPDITISNKELPILMEVNCLVASGLGIITSIKGGYNLSVRGKRKVKKILHFFDRYPPIAGDLACSRIFLMRKVLTQLESQRTYRRKNEVQDQLEKYRKMFKKLKRTAVPIKNFRQTNFREQSIGYFIAGVLDAEGSIGIKKCGLRSQPFVAVAMKDKKVIELFKSFLRVGNIRLRSRDKLYHYECGSKSAVLKILGIFSTIYPSKLSKTKKRINDLQRILNDYTPTPA